MPGLHSDPRSTAMLLGMGGVAAEVFAASTLRLLPSPVGLRRQEALGMVQALKSWPLLDGFRGCARADVAVPVDATSPPRGWRPRSATLW